MSGYNELTKAQKEMLEEIKKKAKEKILLEKKYKEKWHPKKPNRPRGLKKGEWKER